MRVKLNDRRLCLTTALEVKDLAGGMRLLKQTERAEYLALTPAQRQILDCFDGTATVQAILEQLLTQKKRPDIREFYDLVLHANEKDILIAVDATSLEESQAPPAPQAVPWRIGWRFGPVFALFLLLVPTGFWALTLSALFLPVTLRGWFIVILLIILMLTVANLMAACVLRGYRRAVYNPDIEIRYFLPFFRVDKRDSFMGGRMCQIAVALQQLTVPFAVAVAAYILNSSPAMFAAGLTAFLFTSPFGHTPGHDLVHAIFRKAYQLPQCASTFLGKRVLKHILGSRNPAAEEDYLVVYSTYALIWLGSVILFGAGLMRRQGYELLKTFLYSEDWNLRILALLVLLFLIAILFAPLAYQLWILGRNIFTLVAPYCFRAESRIRRKNVAERPGRPDLMNFLQHTLLFADVDEKTLENMLAAMQFVRVKKGTTLIRQGDTGDNMFILYAGRVQVQKEDEAGCRTSVAVLEDGDVFGEIALLEKVPRTASVKALTNIALLVLHQDDFEKVVLPHIAAGTIKERIQISAFLKRHPIFSAWSDKALYQIAHHFSFVSVAQGDLVIKADQAAEAFYIIYEGYFEVIKENERVALLKSDDFFGEISLLNGIDTVADVRAVTDGTCLRLEKEHFCQFISTDLVTGISIEDTAETRLPT